MNIKDNSAQPKFKTKEFRYISTGEAFEYDGHLLIKIFPIVPKIEHASYNAIDLSTGTSESFRLHDRVHQLRTCEIAYEKCLQEELQEG